MGPCAAMLIGCVAGLLSVFGYAKLQPCLERRLGLHDTCGIHNLHGMPGILGGIASIIVIGLDQGHVVGVAQEDIAKQCWKQFWGIVVSLFMALVGGYFTGHLVSEPVFDCPEEDFEDQCNWEMPFEESVKEAP